MQISVGELAKKSGISEGKVQQALSDCQLFKLSQLEKIAQALYVPTVYLTIDSVFYERDVPAITEFRNESDISASNYKYMALVEEFCQVRKNYLEILSNLDEPIPSFELSLTGNNAEDDAEKIDKYFGFSSSKKTANSDDYLKSWRSIVEAKDVIVINKPKEKYGSDGMSLFFESLPIVVIFSSDQSPSRQLFTLVHELVHLGLGQSVFDGYLTKSTNEIERYCDSVAGYVVAPTKVIQAHYSYEKTIADNVDAIRKQTKAKRALISNHAILSLSSFTKHRASDHVCMITFYSALSKAAIAIQLKNINLISNQDLNTYLESIQPPKPNAGGGFGQTKENLVLKYYGKNFVSRVLSALWQENISPSTAQKMLNIKPTPSMSVLNELQAKVFS